MCGGGGVKLLNDWWAFGTVVKPPFGDTRVLHPSASFQSWLPVLSQLPAEVHPEWQQAMAQTPGCLALMGKAWWSSRLLALTRPISGCCGHLGSETADGRPLPLCLSNTMKINKGARNYQHVEEGRLSRGGIEYDLTEKGVEGACLSKNFKDRQPMVLPSVLSSTNGNTPF